jgi:HlyD family secretion protein
MIIGVVVIGGLAIFFATSQEGTPVDTVQVVQKPIREFVDERGKTRLPQTYLITMPSSGLVEGIELTAGTKVEKGQTVAKMVPIDLNLAVDESEAMVRQLKASITEKSTINVEETSLEQAKHFVESMHETVKAALTRVDAGEAKRDLRQKDYDRSINLEKLNPGAQSAADKDKAEYELAASEADYKQDQLVHLATAAIAAATDLLPTMIQQQIDNKGLAVDVLEEQKAAAEARLKQVKENQGRGTMISPVDGVVLERFVDVQQFLPAGTSLLEIGRLEDLEVEADILSLNVVDVKIGDKVEIYGPAIGKEAAIGKVVKVYPAGFTKISSLGVEQQRVKVIIHFEEGELQQLLADRHLGVGYRVRTRIITAEKPNATVVPRSALFRGSGSQWQLYAVEDGRAKIQDVTIGLMNDQEAEVLKGLQPGQTVIIAPETSLIDGTKVSSKEK